MCVRRIDDLHQVADSADEVWVFYRAATACLELIQREAEQLYRESVISIAQHYGYGGLAV